MKTTLFTKAFAVAVALGAVLTSCDSDVFNFNSDPFKDQAYKNLSRSPIAAYIDSVPDFSEYAKALRYSNTFNALNQSSENVTFTAFVPNNEAMAKFYESVGVSSLEELTPEYVRVFVKTHTTDKAIPTEDFIYQKVKDGITNLDDETLSVSIDAEHAGHAILTDNGGNQARVIEMGIETYNGTVYILSQTLVPLVETIKDRVNVENSSIMMQALKATGWDKHLNVIADTIIKDGRKTPVKRFYTFLNVTDQVFAKDGITSFEDLKNRIGQNDDRQVGIDSLLNEYVSYHVMDNSYHLRDLEGDESSTRILGSTAKNQVMSLDFNVDGISVDERLVFNRAGESASFVDGQVNQLAKNGYVHNLSAWLPVWEPEQTEVIWDFADNAIVKAVVVNKNPDNYQPSEPVANEQSISIEQADCFEYEVGEGGSKNSSYTNISYVPSKKYTRRETVDGKAQIIEMTANKNDRVVFNVGYMGTVTMQTPTLVKGKYRVEVNLCFLTTHGFMRNQTDGNGGLMRITFDDRDDATYYSSPYTKIPLTSAGFYTVPLCDEVEFDVTSSHKFKFTVLDPAASSNKGFSLQFDYIRFIPIK